MQSIQTNLQQLSLQQSFRRPSDVIFSDALTRDVPKDTEAPNLRLSKQFSDSIQGLLSFCPTDYTLVKKLGNGAYGEVFLAASSLGDQVVMKRISKKAKNFKIKYIEREAKVGAILSKNENVLACKVRFETENNVYLVLPYFDGLDLISYMEKRDFAPVDEEEARDVFRQIVETLLFCHRNGVGHRDVKCENILLDDNGKVKVIDFGLCSVDDNIDKIQEESLGSPQYVAPELIIEGNYKSFQADVFSTGVVFFCILFGQFPYNQEQRMEALQNEEEFPCPGELPFDVSEDLEDLLIQMMESNPKKRITMEQVAQHKWFASDRS